jgi:hypothetical protein
MRPNILLSRATLVSLAALVALGQGQAQAQSRGACGQPLDLTDVLPGSLSSGFETSRTFVEIRRSEPRYVEFALDAPQPVTLRTEAASGDPTITLYDETGRSLGWDDDSGGSLQALLALELSGGRYCAQLRPAGSSPVEFDVFVLLVESGLNGPVAPEPPCSDPTKIVELARGLSAPVSPVAVEGIVDDATGRGDFLLTLAEPLGLRIDAASGSFDTVLTITDMDGNYVAENDDFSGSDSRIEEAFVPGDYCLSVRSYDGTGGSFTVAVSEADISPPPMPCEDPSLVGDLALAFGPGVAPVGQSGVIDSQIGQSWYRLTVADSVDVRLDLRSDEFDTVLQLFDMGGGLIEENDDGPDGTNSRVEAALAPGDYCVAVRGYADSTGAFDLVLAAAGVPASPSTPDPATAASVEDMGTLSGELRSYTISGDPTLWASFETEDAATVTVQGVSVSSDFSVTLFAEDGTVVAEAGPVQAMSAAEIGMDLDPGRYLVALTNYGGSGTLLRQITVKRD